MRCPETVMWYKECNIKLYVQVYIAWSKGYMRFEAPIAVTVDNAVFWDITVCHLTGL